MAVDSKETLSEAANAQERPAIAYNSDRGRFLAVWEDHRHSTDDPDVYGQLYRGYTVVVNYVYDDLYRLTEASYSDGYYYAYAYDRVGNRTAYTDTLGEVTTYAYDDADRLITMTKAAVATPYTWSDRGELLSDGVQNYTWDAAGRLTEVTGGGGLEVLYEYDGGGNRASMEVNGTKTSYVVDPFSGVDGVPQVLVEETGSASTRYLYGLDLLADQQGSAMTYYAYDALSLRLHLNSSGEIAATYRYAPFGEVVGDDPSGYGFSGEQWDRETELLYLRARYYRPEMGRFLSRDPVPGEFARPATLQKCLYVINNPVNLTDPSGMFVPDPPGGWCTPQQELNIMLYLPYRYSQRDDRWSHDPMLYKNWRPHSRECPDCTIGSNWPPPEEPCGCLLTSATMVFRYYGSTKNPKEVNECMGDRACLWWWDVGATECSQNRAVFKNWMRKDRRNNLPYPSDYNLLLTLLKRRVPPIVAVPSGGGQHWMVVFRVKGTGLRDSDYWVIDPWYGDARPLSNYDDWQDVGWYERQPFVPVP